MDPETAFQGVEKMLYGLAWKCHRTYGVPYEDALSECYYAFVKALNWRWKPGKGTKFSTTVQNIAQWRLKSLIINRANAVPTCELEDHMVGEAKPVRAESLELICDLSEDAKDIVALICETPAEILGASPVPVKQLVSRIKRYLEEQGRERQKLDAAHRELQLRFREAWA